MKEFAKSEEKKQIFEKNYLKKIIFEDYFYSSAIAQTIFINFIFQTKITNKKKEKVNFRRQNYSVDNQLSKRSTKYQSNFVRNSLQLQSRNFEQLCEFMMRVNPMNYGSEGWTESSDEEEKNFTEKHMSKSNGQTTVLKFSRKNLKKCAQNASLQKILAKFPNYIYI